jgi:hypothetical protein
MKARVGFQENDSSFSLKVMELDEDFDADVGELTRVREVWRGATFIPSVSTDGVISWTNDGDLPNPSEVNIRGPKGKTPIKGEDYFTAADKAEMVAAVVAALPVYDGSVTSV